MLSFLYTLFCLVLLAACSPSSLEDFQQEGEARARHLTSILANIETREELVKAEPELKKEFNKLVDLIISARLYTQEHTDEENAEPIMDDYSLNETLKEEMKRIYAIEKGREIVENAQREALLRLDAFEKKSQKKLR